jgi:hypothetical protein
MAGGGAYHKRDYIVVGLIMAVKVPQIVNLGPYSQPFIFFVTYE